MPGCPQTLVDIALSYAPSGGRPGDPLFAKYLDGTLPYDQHSNPSWAARYALPYPDGASSCATFQIANYGRAGFVFPGIGEPYERFVGRAETILVDFGKSKGALETRPDPRTFLPGDVFHVDNISHWGMVKQVVVRADGVVEVHSIDGGQPGIAERVRTVGKSGGAWALFGTDGKPRPVLHVIRAEALDVPCDGMFRGYLNFAVFLLTVGGAAAFTRWLLT